MSLVSRTSALDMALVVCLAMLTPGAPATTQEVSRAQVIRSRVTLVPVEVYVVDRHGRPVTDLRREDFTVLEDGVRQELSAFSTRAFGGADAATPSALDPGTAPTIHTGRTFLVLLGRGRLEHPSMGLTALDQFIRTGLNPADRLALMAYGRVTDATVERDPILRLLRSFSDRHQRIELDLDHWFTGLTLAYGGREVPPSILRRIDDVFDQTGLPPVREVPLVVPPADVEFDEMLRLLWTASDPGSSYRGDERRDYNEERRQDLEALFGAIEHLRHIDGIKHLVFVTENPNMFGLKIATPLKQLANDAGVSIWPLQTGGAPAVSWLNTRPPTFVKPRMIDLQARAELHEIASATGGRASVHEYAAKGLAALELETRFQYVLGYYPRRTTPDGKHHTLTVRVNRRDVDVRYRTGYYARDSKLASDRRQAMARARITAALQYWRELKDIPLAWASPAVTLDPRGRQLVVRGTIDASGVSFLDAEGAATASLDVATFALDRRGTLVGEAWQPVDLKFTDAQLAEARTSGIASGATIVVRGDTSDVREVRFVVYQYVTDRLGSITMPVR